MNQRAYLSYYIHKSTVFSKLSEGDKTILQVISILYLIKI